MSPFLHTDGTVRMKGRLANSTYPFNKINPLILSPDHYITKLVVLHEHVRLMHAGPQQMLSSLRENYWVISGRSCFNGRNSPPLRWKLGRITDVHPGADGVVRVVSIRTSSGTTKRAVRKVCLLPAVTQDHQNL
ncbi:hypothetical protein NQ318_016164 [Aromia moschata]|uniref:DUF5641 domain-containing protein n=1 Tax=Aromia moschata TaxID=1265417 RepID=A0AAV8Y078_9CUCU|nr:hypothetical protein NQ318_016164 [Aromia moschata]